MQAASPVQPCPSRERRASRRRWPGRSVPQLLGPRDDEGAPDSRYHVEGPTTAGAFIPRGVVVVVVLVVL
eukprot:3958266-Pyramimonas_sp.AAC.1